MKETPKHIEFCVLKKIESDGKKKDVLRLQLQTDLISHQGFNQVNKTAYRLSQKMSHQSKALEGKVQESCYN